MDVVKPVVKWVGGKTQILDLVLSRFPDNMNNYHEPFVGGGSVLLGLLSLVKRGNIVVNGDIYASDKNAHLINTYMNIQKYPTDLIVALRVLTEEYNKLNSENNEKPNRNPSNIEQAQESQETYYYWIRKQFNMLREYEQQSCKASAYFIFLNKTCFRGLYREGSNGFNVSFGNYKNPIVFDEEHILTVSSLIQDVVFKTQSFDKSFELIEENDFVYIDPPYAPENNSSFVGYTNDGFNTSLHETLFILCDTITYIPQTQFIMSNAYVDSVIESFSDEKYTIDVIDCKRTINSKSPNSTTKEVLITYCLNKISR